MRKVLTIIIYTIVVLLIGRSLTFLPAIPFVQKKVLSIETDAVENNVRKFVAKQPGNYSVLYTDFASPNRFGISESQIFTGASVNKMQIITMLYYLAGKGKVNLDEKITLQKKDIQDYGTGSLRYQKPGTQYSLKTLAKLALQQSDNTAAKILADKIGRNNIQTLMDEFGLTQTDMENNKTSLTDLEILFRKIYNNEVTTPALTKELLGFLLDTDIEDRLPRFLPDITTVYHKTGDTVGGIHDVGIVETNGKTYFLGVMTSDVGNKEQVTKDAIAAISKMIYETFAK